MGDLQVCSSVQQSGIVLTEGRMCSRPPFSPPSTVSNEGPSLIPEGSWEIAEQATNDIVRRIQPTVAADKKRRDVIEYVQSMIRDFVGCEVFPYGSVPLKTYLHDGDIDLSAVSSSNIEDTLVSDIHAVLKREEQKKEASFQVTDVHCIDAEVKLVKCLVQNIVVDISFNQLGGLGTLCFLEQVNQLVGKDHLFKRSIILTKAWCYYESRILGAHHGLISTYALETLVLYIFHLFHSSLNSPLAVLYRFLDYFSKFDWENYCVSLDGPVSKSSLPHIVAEVPQNGGNDLLLTEGFMKRCVQMFSVPSKGSETNSRAFSLKHFNIIDPLKENNNLGRSVNKGNFYRIRSAFKYGARTLRQILLLPKERIADELNKFFSGTLERHESNHWTCVQDPPVLSGAADTDCSSSTYSDICFGETVLQTLSKDSSTDKTSGMQVVSGFRNEPEKYIGKMVSSQEMPESCRVSDGNPVSACFSGTATQIVTTGFLDERRKNKPSDCLPLNSNVDALFWRKSYNVPQSYFSGLLRQNEKTENGISCRSMPRKSVASDAIYAVSNQECVRPTDIVFSPPAASFSKNVSPGFRERELTGISGSFESPKSLLDLGGDYKNHFWSILHGQDCHLFTVPADVLPYPPMAYQLEHTYPWGPVQRCLPLRHNVSFGKSKNALGGTEYYPVNPPRPSGIAFNSAEKRRHRGRRRRTSNVNHSNWDKPSSRSGTFQEPGAKGQQHAPNKGSSVAPEKRNASKEDNFEVSAEEYPVLGHGKSSSNLYRNHGPAKGPSNATGLSNSSQKLESESPGSLLKEAQCPEEKEQLDAGPKCSRGAARSHKVPAAESSNKNSKESVAEQSYHLMNEVDFPPLSI